MESKYPVINLKLNGANQRLIGLAYQTIAKELNTDENLVDAIDNQALDPTCLVYIYPNAKRLTFQHFAFRPPQAGTIYPSHLPSKAVRRRNG